MDMVNAVMMSSWNSISGPQIEHVWLEKDHDIFQSSGDLKWNIGGYDVPKFKICPMDVFSYMKWRRIDEDFDDIHYVFRCVEKCLTMSGKLLIAEIESRKRSIDVNTRIYYLDGHTLVAAVFKKKPWLDGWKNAESNSHCISFMIHAELDRLHLGLYRVMDIHLRGIIDYIQRDLNMTSAVLADEMAERLGDLTGIVLDAYKTRYPTSFEGRYLHIFSYDSEEMNFLHCSAASHLQTGYSVITGEMEDYNKMLDKILSMLCNNEERYVSTEHARRIPEYIPGFRVQYVAKRPMYYRVDLPREVYKYYPVSIIDPESAEAEKTLPENSCQMVKSVKDCGTFVKRALKDAVNFEENGMYAKTVLKTFSRFLSIKAVALIKAVNAFRTKGTTPTEKELARILNISYGNLRVCVGRAEEIEPGIKSFIAPDK